LPLLRKLGWVHRDVSIGNILSYEGEAKLADLEYAKRVGEVKSHEMRTASGSSSNVSNEPLIMPQQGTMHFMSIEVAAHKFLLFRPHRSRLAAKFTDEKVRELQQRKEQEAVEVHF
jgi:serine/threonine protein kinase